MENKRKLTRKDLISRGYKNYDNHPVYKDTDDIKYEFYQKCIADNNGKKMYFINAIHFIVNTPGTYRGDWSFSIQLNPNDYDTIEVETVQWFNEFSDRSNDRRNSLDKVEELFDKLYRVLNCKSYD